MKYLYIIRKASLLCCFILILFNCLCFSQIFPDDGFEINYSGGEFKLDIVDTTRSYKCIENSDGQLITISRINVVYMWENMSSKFLLDEFFKRYEDSCITNNFPYNFLTFQESFAIQYLVKSEFGTETLCLVFIHNNIVYTLMQTNLIGNSEASWKAFIDSFNLIQSSKEEEINISNLNLGGDLEHTNVDIDSYNIKNRQDNKYVEPSSKKLSENRNTPINIYQQKIFKLIYKNAEWILFFWFLLFFIIFLLIRSIKNKISIKRKNKIQMASSKYNYNNVDQSANNKMYDIEHKLSRLEDGHKEGLINDDEYKRKYHELKNIKNELEKNDAYSIKKQKLIQLLNSEVISQEEYQDKLSKLQQEYKQNPFKNGEIELTTLFYCLSNYKEIGPYTAKTIISMINSNKIKPYCYIRKIDEKTYYRRAIDLLNIVS